MYYYYIIKLLLLYYYYYIKSNTECDPHVCGQTLPLRRISLQFVCGSCSHIKPEFEKSCLVLFQAGFVLEPLLLVLLVAMFVLERLLLELGH